MKKLFLVLFYFIIFHPPFLFSIQFENFIKKGDIGDYVVYEKDKLHTLLIIKNRNSDKIEIEEITSLKDQKDWKKWVISQPQDFLSWTIYEISTKNSISNAFSFSKNCWTELKKEDNLILKLLDLDLIASKCERKIGPPPIEGPDFRKPWKPPLVFEGKKTNSDPLYFESIWEEDSSLLSGVTMKLFFLPQFPFPLWLEADNGHVTTIIKALDAGKNLISHRPSLESFNLRFTENPIFDSNVLLLTLSANIYQKLDWELFFFDNKTKDIFSLPFTCDDKNHLIIASKDLQLRCIKGHSYFPLLRLKSEKTFYIESPFSFTCN